MIEAKDIVKTYIVPPTKALRGVSFDIADGEFVMISGRSGSGKSTLLHQLSLIDQPTSGTITIGGTDVLALSEKARARFRLEKLGYVFQEYALLAEFTSHENVYLPALARGGKASVYKDRAHSLLSLVGLGERVDHYPSELSGGEQQRVAIARSLINDPEVIFADEPTANLDRENARRVFELFSRLQKEMGKTVILVTHEPDEAKPFVDRVFWLDDGRIEHVETLTHHSKTILDNTPIKDA